MQYTDLVLLSFVVARIDKCDEFGGFFSFVFMKSLLIYKWEEIIFCSLSSLQLKTEIRTEISAEKTPSFLNWPIH